MNIAIRTSLFVLVIAVTLLFSGCAMFFPMQSVKAKSATENATVTINGNSVIEGDKIYVMRKRPVVVTSYRFGYRTKSELVFPSQFNTALIFPGAVTAATLSVSQGDPGIIIPYLALFGIDAAVNPKKHKKTLLIGEMDKLPSNASPQFRLWAYGGLDTLAVKDQYEVHYTKARPFLKKAGGDRVPSAERDVVDTLTVGYMVNNMLGQMGYQEEAAGLFSRYDNNLMVDAEMKEFVIHEVSRICHDRELQMSWIIRDNFGKKLYETSVTGKSQVFSNTSDGYSESFEDALLDALLSLLGDPGLIELQEQIAQLHQQQFERFDELVLPGGAQRISARPEDLINSQVTLVKKNSHASGCMISPEGHILATYRILGQREKIDVTFSNGKTKQATVLRADPYTNVVLLKCDTSGTAFIRPASAKAVRVGDDVMAIGSPVNKKLSQSLSTGIVSAERTENGVTFLQTDVKISRGANGSPLINQKGELIGIVNEKYTGSGIEGLSFAVSSADIIQRLKLKYSN
jgi:S1-C subfamily serine protease